MSQEENKPVGEDEVEGHMVADTVSDTVADEQEHEGPDVEAHTIADTVSDTVADTVSD